MMKEGKQFFETFKKNMTNGLYTAALGLIEKYDPAGKADVLILPDKDLISEVPVATLQSAGFFIRVPYKKGDLVVVVFASRSIDGTMHGDAESDMSERTHDINDAMVMGGLNLFAAPLPSTNKDDMVIGKKDGTTRVVIGNDGNVTVEASGKIFLGDGATQGVPLGQQLKTWLDSHTHGSSGAGAPTSASPAPSGKVFAK